MGFGFQAAAKRQQGTAMQAGYEYNARLDEQQKLEIERAGKLEQFKLWRARTALNSTQQALYSKAGVLIQGSPAEVMAQSATDAIMDSMIVGYNTKSAMIRAQANADYKRWQGATVKRVSEDEATSTMIAGGLDTAMKGATLLSRFNWGRKSESTIPTWNLETA